MKKNLLIFVITTLILYYMIPSLYAQWKQTSGPYGGIISSVAACGNRVYAGSFLGGLFFSSDNGANWNTSGMINGVSSKTVTAITSDGNNILFWGGGFFLSKDNGLTWSNLSDVQSYMATYDGTIVLNGNNIFIGTFGDGIYHSANMGISWTLKNNGLSNLNISSLAKNGNYLYAGTGSGLYISINDGMNWIKSDGIPDTYVTSILCNGNKTYAGTAGGLFLSTDNGKIWTAINNGLTCWNGMRLAFNGNILFASTYGCGIFVSANDGKNWSAVNNGLTTLNVNAIFYSGGSLFAGTDQGIFQSINNGNNWNNASYGITGIGINDLLISANNIFAATSNGVFLSNSGGTNWNQMNNGMKYKKSVKAITTYGNNIFIGTEMEGVLRSSNNGIDWIPVNNGLTTNTNIISIATCGNNILAGTVHGIFKSTDDGSSWTSVNNGIPGSYIGRLVINGNNIYALVGSPEPVVYFSMNNGTSWNAISNGIQHISSIAVDGNNICVGCLGGVYLSSDNGSSWNRTNWSTNTYVGSLAISGSNIIAGTGFYGIFISTDNGNTWNSINNGLDGDLSKSFTKLLISNGNVFAVSNNQIHIGQLENIINSVNLPVANTTAAGNILTRSATLNGNVMANNSSTTIIFEYGKTTSYGNTAIATPNIATGNTSINVSSAITGLEQNTLYHFRVKAANSSGIAYGSNMTFKTLEGISVTSVTPEFATLNQMTTFTISGTNLTSGMGFWVGELEGITELPNGTSTMRQFQGTPKSTIGIKDGLVKDKPNGTLLYSFKVTVNSPSPLSAATLLTPANGALNQSNSPNLAWSTVSGANSYKLQVSSNNNFSTTSDECSNCIMNVSQSTTGKSLANLSDNTTYYWRVKAENTSIGQSGTWSSVFSFKTAPQTKNVPISFYPADNTLGIDPQNPNFSWNNNNTSTLVSSVKFTLKKFSGYQGTEVTTLVNGQSLGSSAKNFTYSRTLENGVWYKYWIELSFNDGSNAVGAGAFFKTASPVVKITPGLTISPVSITQGSGTVTIKGSAFTPNGQVNLGITDQTMVLMNSSNSGDFQYNFNVNVNTPAKIYYVNAKDMTTGISSLQSSFNINSPSPSNFIEISVWPPLFDEESSKSYYSSSSRFQSSISWTWNFPWNMYNPVTGWDYFRFYNLQYYNEGKLFFNETNKICDLKTIAWVRDYAFVNYSFNNFNLKGRNKIRINLTNYPNCFKEFEFNVVDNTNINNCKVEKKWDYSCPLNSGNPKGVAADGVSRIYLKITNPNTTKQIKTIKATLSGKGTATRTLGKIMKATVTNAYSEEANSANSTTITENYFSNQSEHYFWYVAPEDFDDETASSRVVQCDFDITYSDNTTEKLADKIEIVRPTLMFVHGIAADKGGTFDNFGYVPSGSSQKVLYINDPRFINETQVMYNSAIGVNSGAAELLVENRSYSFAKATEYMRNMGYASVQVYYICHSMGGLVIKNAIHEWGRAYYGEAINQKFKTYGKGYVNRIITVNTPHKGSKWADLLNEFIKEMNNYTPAVRALGPFYGMDPENIIFTFIKPNFGTAYWGLVDVVNDWEATTSAKDLMEQEGYRPNYITKIPSHLIASDVFPGESAIPEIPEQFFDAIHGIEDLLNCWTEIADVVLQYFPLSQADKNELKNLIKSSNNASKAVKIVDWLATLWNVGAYMVDSDLIVGLKSQTAGLSSMSQYVSVFDQDGLTHVWPRAVLDNDKVGSKVNILLNSSIANTSYFGDIPVTTYAINKVSSKLSQRPNIQKSIVKTNSNEIEISSPTNGQTVEPDSSLKVRFRLSNIVNLDFVKVKYLGNNFIDTTKSYVYEFNIPITGKYLDSQRVEVMAYYQFSDSSLTVKNSVMTFVLPKIQPDRFEVNPTYKQISVDEILFPEYKAYYPTFISRISYTGNSISATVADPSIVSFEQALKAFKGLKAGSTFAIIKYKNLSDTIYLQVIGKDGLSTPSTPALNYPENYSGSIPTNTKLQWCETLGAANYYLQVDTSSSFQTSFVNKDMNSDLEYTLSNLKTNRTYYWRVKASNSAGESFWSNVWNFTTMNNAPNKFILLSPTSNETINLTYPPKPIVFEWNKSSDYDEGSIVKYTLHISGDGYNKIIRDIQDTTLTTDIMKYLNNSKSYKWFVVASDGKDSTYSDTLTFRASNIITGTEFDLKIFPAFSLQQNYPNPFNPQTIFEYSIPENIFVTLSIFDVYGKEVANLVSRQQNAGTYRVTWEPKNISSGVYYYRMQAGRYREMKKMLYLR